MKYLRKQEFKATSGVQYKFDAKGDMLGEYTIFQYTWNNKTWSQNIIGEWKKDGEILKMDKNLSYIESICSKPCPPKHIYLQQELSCCWICKTCRENEYISENKTDCEICPKFYWPGIKNIY